MNGLNYSVCRLPTYSFESVAVLSRRNLISCAVCKQIFFCIISLDFHKTQINFVRFETNDFFNTGKELRCFTIFGCVGKILICYRCFLFFQLHSLSGSSWIFFMSWCLRHFDWCVVCRVSGLQRSGTWLLIGLLSVVCRYYREVVGGLWLVCCVSCVGTTAKWCVTLIGPLCVLYWDYSEVAHDFWLVCCVSCVGTTSP